MAKKLILVGCGNVGSRHLQALAKLPYNIVVDIAEPDKKSQELAKLRLNEIKYDKNTHVFHWHESIKDLENSSDLVIIATSSVGRAGLINQLLELGHSRFLIEKVVCQSTKEYNLLLSKIKKFGAKGWVNTTPRCFKSYQKIKKHVGNADMLHLSVTSSNNSALGTNALHYIDLFCWLVNDFKVKLNGDFLLDELFRNKRGKDLKEFAGTLMGTVKSGSTLTLTFIPNSNLSTMVTISTKSEHFVIDETKEKIFVLNSKDQIKWEFRYEHISNLTTSIVKDIFEKDFCMLPTLQDSFYAHSELFRVFNAQIYKLLKKEVKLCPIT